MFWRVLVRRIVEGGEGHVPALFFCGALDALAYFEGQFGEPLDCDFLARVQQPEYVLHCYADLLDQVDATTVQQPPAQTQVPSICLEVIAVGLLEVVVVVVLEVDAG